MKAIVLHFHHYRIRKMKERVAYWKARANIYRAICSHPHMSYESNALVEAVSEQARYEARLDSLQNDHALDEKRSDDSQQRVVGRKVDR